MLRDQPDRGSAAFPRGARPAAMPEPVTSCLPPSRPDVAVLPVLAVAGAVLLAHLLTNAFTPYGVHRDELLYMAMGRHLRFFAMDFPPFIAILAEVSRAAGDSLVILRLAPALASAALVILAAVIARELGGGRYAQLLAGTAVAAGPLYLRSGNLFQPVILDQLWWTLALVALVRLGTTGFRGEARWWIILGIACGAGLLTKFSIVFIGLGIVVAIVVGPERRALATRWPWLALLTALVVGSPSILGQVRLGFPVLAQMRDLQGTQLEHVSYGAFLTGQLLMLGPALALAALGFGALIISQSYKSVRTVGWATGAAFLVIMLLHGKPYYAGPIYPALLGAGAAVAERAVARLARERGSVVMLVRGAVVVLIAAYGLLTLPLGLPILPPEPMARYAATLGMTAAVQTNRGTVLPLPQDYADMLGWEAQVAAVARVYHALPPTEQAQAAIVAANYGEAGAVDFYGPRYGLPPAVAPVGSYWFFGPGEKPGAVIIKVGGTAQDLAPLQCAVTLAGRVNEPWVVPEEQDLKIWLCRHPRRTLQQLWPELAGRN